MATPLVALGLLVALACTEPGGLDEAYVVDGYEVDIGQAPFMVALEAVMSDGSLVHWCGGAYLGDRWVVTAAHCVQALPSRGAGWAVLSGTTSYPDQVTVGGTTLPAFETRPPGMTDVVAVDAFAGYDPSTASGDLALVELAAPPPGATSIALVSAADEATYGSLGHEGRLFGWGTTIDGQDSSLSPHLRAADVAVGGADDARANNDELAQVIPLLLVDGNACHGDSGGPFVVFADGGAPRLAGVISHAGVTSTCGPYTAATRLTTYAAWIDETTAIATPGGF